MENFHPILFRLQQSSLVLNLFAISLKSKILFLKLLMLRYPMKGFWGCLYSLNYENFLHRIIPNTCSLILSKCIYGFYVYLPQKLSQKLSQNYRCFPQNSFLSTLYPHIANVNHLYIMGYHKHCYYQYNKIDVLCKSRRYWKRLCG